MNPYEVLKLQEGADKARVKRAYFRLLREHSPEKDPEGFARIREAYEQLSEAEEVEAGPSFSIPDHPYARMFADQVERCRKEGRKHLAKETAEEGWERFPDTLYFLYQTAVMQRECGNTGKAVKNARLLVEKEPGNKWFWRELAMSSYMRGYTNKAYPAFRKAWEMGCRDMDFLHMYALECRECDDPKTGREILLPLTDSGKRWKREEIEDAQEAFIAQAYFETELGDGSDMDELARRYGRFLERYRTYLTGDVEVCADILGVMFANGVSPSTAGDCMRAIQKLAESGPDTESREENLRYLDGLRIALMNHDENVCRSLQYMNELLALPEESDRYSVTDCKLCLIEEREKILETEEYIRENYPSFYEEFRPFLERIRKSRDAEAVRYRLLQDYRRMMEYYEPGNYLRWHPERRDDVFGRQVATSEESFVRSGKKIGRNDPCPCGSGKKYKFCCGRGR